MFSEIITASQGKKEKERKKELSNLETRKVIFMVLLCETLKKYWINGVVSACELE